MECVVVEADHLVLPQAGVRRHPVPLGGDQGAVAQGFVGEEAEDEEEELLRQVNWFIIFCELAMSIGTLVPEETARPCWPEPARLRMSSTTLVVAVRLVAHKRGVQVPALASSSAETNVVPRANLFYLVHWNSIHCADMMADVGIAKNH